MDMKVDSKRIRDERVSRAWSQEHLATITGLGLRTIQRIENSGSASHESIAAIASVMEVPVDHLLVPTLPSRQSLASQLLAKRLWILLPCVIVAAVMVSPPNLSSLFLVIVGLWIGFEAFIAATGKAGTKT